MIERRNGMTDLQVLRIARKEIDLPEMVELLGGDNNA